MVDILLGKNLLLLDRHPYITNIHCQTYPFKHLEDSLPNPSNLLLSLIWEMNVKVFYLPFCIKKYVESFRIQRSKLKNC